MRFNLWKPAVIARASLCEACRNATVVSGYRGEKVVICTVGHLGTVIVPFAVDECTGFVSKYLPTNEELEKMAKA